MLLSTAVFELGKIAVICYISTWFRLVNQIHQLQSSFQEFFRNKDCLWGIRCIYRIHKIVIGIKKQKFHFLTNSNRYT